MEPKVIIRGAESNRRSPRSCGLDSEMQGRGDVVGGITVNCFVPTGSPHMRTKILLIYPRYIEKGVAEFPPLGVGYLASYLLSKHEDINIKVIDFMVEPNPIDLLRKELTDFNPDIVGISTLTLNFHNAALTAELVRKINPNIPIAIGGIHATVDSEECLDYCDIVIRGEGEESFDEIVRGQELHAIRGISYSKNGKIFHNEERERIQDLDSLPFPAYHLFKMERYKKAGIIGERGCPFNCIYCSSPNMWGRIVRFRSPENIIKEIEYLFNKFGTQQITFHDDTFNLDPKRAMEICDLIIKRGLNKNMHFECQMRVNEQLTPNELFRKMKEANFTHILFGIESGSNRVLKSINKAITPDEVKRAIKLAREAGINWITGFFMVGNWDETVWDVMKTWALILSNDIDMKITICTPLPGTRLHSMLSREGYMNNDLNWNDFDWGSAVTRTNRMSKELISVMYMLSLLLLHLPTGLLRGKRIKDIISNTINYVQYKIRYILA